MTTFNPQLDYIVRALFEAMHHNAQPIEKAPERLADQVALYGPPSFADYIWQKRQYAQAKREQ